jgi:hypothetical protein
MQSAETIKAMAQEHRGYQPTDDQVAMLLSDLDPDEPVLWCAGYGDLSQKFGPVALLALTPERLINIKGKLVGKDELSDIGLDQLTSVEDFAKPVMLGLMTNHHLVITWDGGRMVWQDLPDGCVAAGAQAIKSAKEAAVRG